MAKKLSSTEDLQLYCITRLGHPVINVNVEQSQLDDRIDDALQLFTQRHYNGYTEVYVAREITSADADRGYIELPDNITAVTEVYNLSSQDSSVEAFERLSYRLANSEIFDFLSQGGGGLVNYHMTMAHIGLVQEMFVPKRTFNFNGLTHRFETVDALSAGGFLVYRAYEVVDAEDFEDVYNNEWVKKYSTALVKQQWGTNLKKYDGVQMPGGISLNGQTIYDEATSEIEKLETEFSQTYELPLDMTWA